MRGGGGRRGIDGSIYGYVLAGLEGEAEEGEGEGG